MSYLKRYWFLIFVIFVLGYCTNNFIQQNNQENELEAKKQLELTEKNNEIVALIKKHDANYEWVDALKINRDRRKILTSELQDLWGINKPIVYAGRIYDITINNESSYILEIKKGLLMINLPSIELNLVCNKDLIDNFLSNNKDYFEKSEIGKGVVVIATFEKFTRNKDGINIAIGKCIELIRDVPLRRQYPHEY